MLHGEVKRMPVACPCSFRDYPHLGHAQERMAPMRRFQRKPLKTSRQVAPGRVGGNSKG